MRSVKSYPKHWVRPIARLEPTYGAREYGVSIWFGRLPHVSIWLGRRRLQFGLLHHPSCDCDQCIPF